MAASLGHCRTIPVRAGVPFEQDDRGSFRMQGEWDAREPGEKSRHCPPASTVRQVESGHSYEESYDTLILSPGAQPLLPPLQGLREAERVFTLRSIPDMDRIMQFLEREQPRRAIVIGGGFVGLEMAENLVRHGLQVTLVEKHTQVLTPLDAEMVTPVQQHLVEKGVELILGDGALAFAQQGRRVMLQSGSVLEADMVVLAVGVRPEQALAKQEGLAIGKTGGILVDQFLRTSDKHIYAIGDAIAVKHAISGERGLIPLAGPANRQGRMVADIIYGRRKPYAGTLGTAIVKVFELTVAMTGVSEKTLLRLGWPYAVVHINAASHPGYYPGSHPIALKLLFHPRTGVIYGAQAVGQDGVDKRMDVLATAIQRCC